MGLKISNHTVYFFPTTSMATKQMYNVNVISWTPACLLFKHISDHIIIQKALLSFFGTQYCVPKISLCYKISLLTSAFDKCIFSVYKRIHVYCRKFWGGGRSKL